MGFEPIRRLLPNAIKSAGIADRVDASRVVSAFDATVRRHWGEAESSYVRSISFSQGVLKVAVSSPTALQAIRLESTRFQNETNRMLGGMMIREIRFHSDSF